MMLDMIGRIKELLETILEVGVGYDIPSTDIPSTDICPEFKLRRYIEFVFNTLQDSHKQEIIELSRIFELKSESEKCDIPMINQSIYGIPSLHQIKYIIRIPLIKKSEDTLKLLALGKL